MEATPPAHAQSPVRGASDVLRAVKAAHAYYKPDLKPVVYKLQTTTPHIENEISYNL